MILKIIEEIFAVFLSLFLEHYVIPVIQPQRKSQPQGNFSLRRDGASPPNWSTWRELILLSVLQKCTSIRNSDVCTILDKNKDNKVRESSSDVDGRKLSRRSLRGHEKTRKKNTQAKKKRRESTIIKKGGRSLDVMCVWRPRQPGIPSLEARMADVISASCSRLADGGSHK